MPLTADFMRITDSLRVPSMGTENVAFLLYSLTRMLRPRSVLEIGSGYTTMFLAEALADAAAEAAADRQLLEDGSADDRARLLSERARHEYDPMLFAFDTLVHERTSAGRLPEALAAAGLAERVTLATASFRGASALVPASRRPLDLIWFDCGGAGLGGIDFLNEYWPLVNDNGGIVGLHSMRVAPPLRRGRPACTVPSPLLNELLRRQAAAGPRRAFEILSLAEPHKAVQSDVTLLKKVGALDAIREVEFSPGPRPNGKAPPTLAFPG